MSSEKPFRIRVRVIEEKSLDYKEVKQPRNILTMFEPNWKMLV